MSPHSLAPLYLPRCGPLRSLFHFLGDTHLSWGPLVLIGVFVPMAWLLFTSDLTRGPSRAGLEPGRSNAGVSDAEMDVTFAEDEALEFSEDEVEPEVMASSASAQLPETEPQGSEPPLPQTGLLGEGGALTSESGIGSEAGPGAEWRPARFR